MNNISILTALAIQNNPDLSIESGFDKLQNKWAGFVYIIDSQERPRLILSTKAVFITDKDAEIHLATVVNEIKNLDLLKTLSTN